MRLPNREHLRSLNLYARALLRHWLFFALFVGAGAVGLAQEYWTKFALSSPGWIAIAVASLVVAGFMAYHDVRLERDAVMAQLEGLNGSSLRTVVERGLADAERFLERFKGMDPPTQRVPQTQLVALDAWTAAIHLALFGHDPELADIFMSEKGGQRHRYMRLVPWMEARVRELREIQSRLDKA